MIFHKGRHTISKIVCLALGLAISSIIIAQLYFQQTFDTHFPGAGHTYQIMEKYKMGDMKESKTNGGTPGGWALGLKSYTPIVEAATRMTNLFGDITQMRLDDGNVITSRMTAADSCLFDVFPRRILAGNPKEVLSRPGMVMVSSDVARRIGGNVVGRRFTIDNVPGATFIIGGVFEAFPWGWGMHGEDMLLSLNSLKTTGYSGMDNWFGNDRYSSFIRLAKGHKPEELRHYARKALRDNVDKSILNNSGIELGMEFMTPNEVKNSNDYVKQMKWILGIVAFVLLFSSLMNYLLIVISGMSGRSREMAVRKCYGAKRHNIFNLVLGETALDVLLAVLLSALLVYLCKGTIEAFLDAPLSALIFNSGSWILAALVLLIILIGGAVPAWLYNRIPVTVAFRWWTENRHRWKVWLLGAEIAIVGLMFSLLFIVGSQYHKMTHLDPGYDYRNVAIFFVQGINGEEQQKLLNELNRMPQVKMAGSAARLPIDGWYGSGKNVSLPGADRELFNAEDLYGVSDHFFDLMGIRILDGTFFTDRSDTCRQVMVDENFAKKLRLTAHLKGSVVGQRISVSEHCNPLHPTVTIVGVFNRIQLGGVEHGDERAERPIMIFYEPKAFSNLLLKLNELTPEVMQQVREKLERLYPGKQISLYSYATEYENQYISQRNFRNAVMAGGIVVLIIALLGLVGYTDDEVQRRSKEIAIRKVNGARVGDILRLFLSDILKVAVPGIAIGCVGAWIIASSWLQNFTVRIRLTPWPFVAAAIGILLIITASVAAGCYRIARSNPVKYLKDE